MEKIKEPENFDHKIFAVKAKAIYKEQKTDLEEKYKGYYAAVHVDSEEVFIGETQIQVYYTA